MTLRRGMWVCLLIVIGGLTGCDKGAPPPAAPPTTPAIETTPPADAAAPATTPQSAPATTSATGPTTGAAVQATPIKIDANLQKSIRDWASQRLQASEDISPMDLRFVGLAMHNYADTYQGFPATNGPGRPEVPGQGLSWRVMLLPYLEQQELYDQFHLDEPWDSAHNKTLITQMPAIFGKDPAGKTRLHVLTGDDAPFNPDKQLRFRDLVDGTSNTIMLAIAGEDKAEEWTKPGGLPFKKSAPLECLGKLGETFHVVLCDGATLKLKSSINPDLFRQLAQRADGENINQQQLDQARIGRNSTTLPKINTPTHPVARAAGINVNFIHPDAFAALVIHPRRFHDHPVVKAVLAQVPQEMLHGTAAFGRDLSRNLNSFQEVQSRMGISSHYLDEVVFVLDKTMPEHMVKNPFSAPPFGIVYHNSAPLDSTGILNIMANSADTLKMVEHEGVTIILEPQHAGYSRRPVMLPDRPALEPPPPVDAPSVDAPSVEAPIDNAAPTKDDGNPCQATDEDAPSDAPSEPAAAPLPEPEAIGVAFINDTVMLMGTEGSLKKMISARNSNHATGLTRQISRMGSPLVALAIDTEPARKPLRELFREAPASLTLISPFVLGMKELQFSFDLEGTSFLNLTATFATPDMASGVFAMLNGQLEQLKEQYPRLRDSLSGDPQANKLLPYSNQFVNDSKLTVSGPTLTFAIPQLKDLDQLPTALKPYIDSALEAQLAAERLLGLKQIGLAMHNYHDVWRHMPALDSNGEPDQRGKGLSWRVHILPYVDEGPLYNEFKLDEPWDSPHNKALIPRMPKVYGSSPEGKSTIHVLTGEGLPFQNEKGPGIRDITDGLSNTILAVETDADVAEIWTKPGGLPFDITDPLKCLGKAKTAFLAVLFDGSARRLENLDPAIFSKAVRHQDGESFDLP